MGRIANTDRYQRIAEVIAANPGIRPRALERAVGIPFGGLTNYLSLMERLGYLISEDDHRLYYHGRAELSGLKRLP